MSKNKLFANLKKITPLYLILFLFLFFYVFVLCIPLLWAATSSVKTASQFRVDPIGFFPNAPFAKWGWNNYVNVMQAFNLKVSSGAGFKTVYLPEMVWNTILFAVGALVISLTSEYIVAYAVTRFRYKFNKVIYTTVIVTMIIPIVGTLPAQMTLMQNLGLLNSVFGVWIRSISFGGTTFLILYAALLCVPYEYTEAGYMDGASELRIMVQIIFPMVRNILFILGLQSFIGLWNDYQTPLLYMPSYPTFAYGLFKFNDNANTLVASVPSKLAGCMLIMFPILVVFFVFRKKMMGGLNMGGLKG